MTSILSCMMDGTYSIDDSEHGLGKVVVLKGPWRQEYKKLFQHEGIQSLRLSGSAGWEDDTIDFVAGLPLRGLEVYSTRVRNIESISELQDLRLLGLDLVGKPKLDFENLSQLRVLFTQWSPGLEGFLDCVRLEYLNLESWPEKDLTRLTRLQNLRELLIVSRNLESLVGLEKMSQLSQLDLHRCSKLVDINAVRCCRRLKHLAFASCKQVTTIAALGGLRDLEVLKLDDCEEIDTLTPISGLANLRSLSFAGDTRIVDGDLSPILKLPKLKVLMFKPRRGYSHRRQEILDRSGR